MKSQHISKKGDYYASLLQSKEWRLLRLKILNRDRNTCQKCGSKENLNIHHKEYFIDENNEFFKPHEYPLNSLITLCKQCHENIHNDLKIPIKKFNKMKLLEFFRAKTKKVEEISDENENFVNHENYSVEHLNISKSPFESVAEIVLENYSKRGFDDSKIISDVKFLNDNLEKLKMECIVKTDLALQKIKTDNLNLKAKMENLKSMGITNALHSIEYEMEKLDQEREKILEYKDDFENGGKFWNAIYLSYQNGFKEGIVASQKQ